MSPLPSDLHQSDDERSRMVRLAEQRRIAQVLHDTVSQTLTAAYLQAVVLARKMAKDKSRSAADVSHLAGTLHEAVEELQKVTRLLSAGEENSAGAAGTSGRADA